MKLNFLKWKRKRDPEREWHYRSIKRYKNFEKDKDEILAALRSHRPQSEAPPIVTANNVLKVAAIIGGMVVLSILIICAYLSKIPEIQFIVACVSLLSFLMAGMGLSE